MNRLLHALSLMPAIAAAREDLDARRRAVRQRIVEARRAAPWPALPVAIPPAVPPSRPRTYRRTKAEARAALAAEAKQSARVNVVAFGPLQGPVSSCRRCSRPKVNRPRGLCWTCWNLLARVGRLEEFPTTSRHGRRGIGNGFGGHVLPASPTTAPPGSAEKLLVLEARALARVALHHPADARYAGDSRPLEFLPT